MKSLVKDDETGDESEIAVEAKGRDAQQASGRALWARTTFGGTTVLGPCTVWVRTIGSRRPATAGRGVRRHPRATVPSSGAVTGGPLAGTASSARGAACSFWTGLMLSPWRLSVARGTQLPQCVGAHVPLGNSGTHGWLGWSVTLQLSPIQLHVLKDLCLPLLYYSWRMCLRNCLTRLRGQLERRSGYAARSRLLDKRGRGTLKKSTKARGGRNSIFEHRRGRSKMRRGRRSCCRRAIRHHGRSRKADRVRWWQQRGWATDL